MLQKKIKRILNEIKFSQEQSDELRDKFGWRYAQTQNPKTNNKYKKLRFYFLFFKNNKTCSLIRLLFKKLKWNRINQPKLSKLITPNCK